MDAPADAPVKAPRMSIRFNTSKPNGKPNGKPSSLGKRSRPHALGGSDSESEHGSDPSDDERHGGRIVFEDDRRRDRQRDGDRRRDEGGREGGGRDGSPSKGEILVIGDVPKIIKPPQQSRRPKMRNRVVGSKHEEVTKDVEPADEAKEVKWGLNLTKKAPPSASPASQPDSSAEKERDDKPKGPKTVDEQAMDRLLGRSSPSAEKVIPLTEKEAYSRDVADAPDPDAPEADTGIDVTEFGAAMLRGMGWDGEFSRPGFKRATRRPNQLGLGAKELKDEEDLGRWNQTGKGGDRPKRLADYRREKEKERESRGVRDSYKRERERERERERDRDRDRDRRYDRDDRRRY
ncbi:hypothetical protein VUR80DRAFT_7082 [Thermomyces stellatus]